MSGKRRIYPTRVYPGIYDHRKQLGDAALLLVWYIDRTTREEKRDDGSRVGWAFGGRPCSDASVGREFGESRKVIRRLRKRLAAGGYIDQKRTPLGYVITVMRSKKWVSGDAMMSQTWTAVVASSDSRCPGPGHPNKEIHSKTKQESSRCPAPSGFAFQGQILEIREREDVALGMAFPWADLRESYQKMDAWLVCNPERRIRKFASFAHNWPTRERRPEPGAEIGYFLTMELEDEYQSLLEHGKALSESEQARLRELEQMKRTGSCGRAQ